VEQQREHQEWLRQHQLEQQQHQAWMKRVREEQEEQQRDHQEWLRKHQLEQQQHQAEMEQLEIAVQLLRMQRRDIEAAQLKEEQAAKLQAVLVKQEAGTLYSGIHGFVSVFLLAMLIVTFFLHLVFF